jgi:peptide deformylase
LHSILQVPNLILKQKAKDIPFVDENIFNLMDEMLVTMRENEGCGLAANQIGILKKIVVVELKEIGILKLANPTITWASKEIDECEEGCLSVKGQKAIVLRPKAIKMSYIDENNNKKEIDTDDFLARCLQHEIDHLNGVVYLDYLSPLKRNMMIKKVKKFTKC